MKIDYDVGDVVVRVDDVLWNHEKAPPKNHPVRAVRIEYNWDCLGVTIDGYPSDHISGQWRADHFRKLLKADDEFTEYMRSMKPHKQPVDA